MARTVGIGHQDFGQLIQNDYFYVDKTGFIGMVGKWRCGDTDNSSSAFWQDSDHEYDGTGKGFISKEDYRNGRCGRNIGINPVVGIFIPLLL